MAHAVGLGGTGQARRALYAGAHARARRFQEALAERDADFIARASLSAGPGLRLGCFESRRRAGFVGPVVQSAGGPPAAKGVWPAAASLFDRALARGARRRG